MKSYITKGLAGLSLLVCHLSAPAEDIDLFVGANTSSTSEVPNVLLIVDNTANWNTAFTDEMAALSSMFSGLPTGKFRIGIMMFTETGSGNSGNDGSYVRAAIRLIDSTNKTKYQSLVTSLDKIDDKSNGGKAGLAMIEAYQYFIASTPYAGNNKKKTDYTGNTTGTTQDKAIYALTGNALTAKAGTTYANPNTSSCQKNYIIYLSNGPAQDNNNDITTATTKLSAAGGSTTMIPISPTGSDTNVADEWARFMYKNKGIVTYTIDVNPGTTGQGPGWTALLKSMASISNGKYFAVNQTTGGSSAILDALNHTLSEIQDVNSVFAAVSLPVSVNTQGTYLNQVFVGMFRPDANDMPRWAGNLKQYKMGFSNNTLALLDADDKSAINSQTGFITECARSYWTPTTADTYWTFKPQGSCIPPPGSSSDYYYMNSNYPDGNIVEKGGQGYQLRSTTTRTVKTCSTSFASCTSMINFDNTISPGALGASSTTERDALVNFALGRDVDDENINSTSTTEMRPSAHADVVHSRPVAIDFGANDSHQVVVFYGSNDGMLHAINGNRDASTGSTAAGAELWSFIAPESYANIKRLRNNSTPVSTATISGSPKPYGFDGPITAYKSGSSAWVYATMRRGGRALYAFDVSTPSNPSLKWKIGCGDNFSSPGTVGDANCKSDFTGIGQTWSSAKIVKTAGYGSGATPMIIMGGGYDTCEDSDPNTCTASTKGNKIYVVDANTGNWLKTLNTDRAVVGDVTLVRDVTTGLSTYAYAADLGGNVYRITMGNDIPENWTITKIASLGCETPVTCSNHRKFMFAPDVVVENGIHIVMVGSGDREKPLSSYTNAYGVSNYFFMLKDNPSDSTWLSSETGNCGGASLICKASLLGITSSATPNTVDLAGKKGWYLALASHEQVVTSSVTLFGVVTFSTHQPAVVTPGSCGSNLGTANVYNIHYTDASPAFGTDRYEHVMGDGLPPSPVAGKVKLDDGTMVPFVIGASSKSPLEATQGNPGTSPVTSQPKTRVYWYTK